MIKFGVAGNSTSFFNEGYSTTIEAAEWCKNRNIDVFEYSFGRGVTLPDTTAKKIGEAFNNAGVTLTVHAPYFINLANTSSEMIEKSIGYITSSIKKVLLFGGDRVVVHPASQGKLSREDATRLMCDNALRVAEGLDEKGYNDVKVCYETMGKQGQMGTVDEIIKMCSLDDRFYPCIDFGHINAREQGILKCADNYNTIVQKMFDFLPKHKVLNTHVHFSKIQYGPKGELRHLTFEDTKYGPNFEPLAEILIKYDMSPYIICESDGTQAEDAIAMKNIYFSALNNR